MELAQREHSAAMESLVRDLHSVSLWNSDKHLGSNLDDYRHTEQMNLPSHTSVRSPDEQNPTKSLNEVT